MYYFDFKYTTQYIIIHDISIKLLFLFRMVGIQINISKYIYI